MVTKRKQNPTYGRKDHTGERYGMLTVVELTDQRYNREWYWRCRCDCGTERNVPAGRLAKTHSCGCTKFYKKLSLGIAARNRRFAAYQSGARKRGYGWDLSVDEFAELVSQDCHYCGCTPGNVSRTGRSQGDFVCNGLDRRDNDKGYDLSNVVPCCWICNKAKGSLSYDEFRKWIFRVAEHQRTSEEF